MDIRTFDNFLSGDEMKILEGYFTGNIWEWGHTSKSVTEGSIQRAWFSTSFDDKPYFTEYLKEKIENFIGIKCHLLRVYANGQILNTSGSWHTDSDYNDYITALLYVSNITPYNVGEICGYTNFKSSDGNIISIEPLKNRLVVFDSQILHQGCAPEVPGFLRISVAWKLKKEI